MLEPTSSASKNDDIVAMRISSISQYLVTADGVAVDRIAAKKREDGFVFCFLAVSRKSGKSGMTNDSDSVGIKRYLV